MSPRSQEFAHQERRAGRLPREGTEPPALALGSSTVVWFGEDGIGEWLTAIELDAGWMAALALALLLLLVLVYHRLRRSLPRWRRFRRQRRAQWGEEAAAQLLLRRGYQVIASQASERRELWLDGVPVPFTVQADYLVLRRGKCYVAEVKTGRSAPSVRNANTRRQLLEYSQVFDCDGVLLVDMEAQCVHEVCFRRAE